MRGLSSANQLVRSLYALVRRIQNPTPENMLLLAVHTVDAVTAKVPLSMVMLLDHIKRKAIPADLHIRLVLPTSGLQSTSLWDAPCIEALQVWLDENLGVDCKSEVFEVQEDFTYGVSLELARVRAGEKIAAGSRKTVDVIQERAQAAAVATQRGIDNFDQKTGVITAAKETTAAAVSKVRLATASAMENEKVQSAISSVSGSWKRAGTALWFMGESFARSVSSSTHSNTAPPPYSSGDPAADVHGPSFDVTTDDAWHTSSVAEEPVSEPAVPTSVPVSSSNLPVSSVPQ